MVLNEQSSLVNCFKLQHLLIWCSTLNAVDLAAVHDKVLDPLLGVFLGLAGNRDWLCLAFGHLLQQAYDHRLDFIKFAQYTFLCDWTFRLRPNVDLVNSGR